jgi:hypothetical protein
VHVGDDFAREVDRTEEVQLEGALPFYESGGEKTFGRWASGVGHANVDAAEFVGYVCDEAADGRGVADVDGLGKNLGVVLLSDLLRGSLQGLQVAGAHGNAAPFGGEGFGGGAANALTGSGYEGNTIFQAEIHGGRIINGALHIRSLAGVSSRH